MKNISKSKRNLGKQVIAAVMALSLAAPLYARYNPKPRWSLFSVQQEVDAGKQYSAEIEKELPLVNDAEVSRYVERLGQRLAAKAPGNKYPYSFKVVNQKEINAFALPGGPIYINLGTIQAASNESELAGVLGHEISHVVMRHSVNQASKQMAAQLPLAILGGKLGGSMAGQLAQLGLGFGLNSIFMKYSRDAEREADLVGADILHDSGYNPQGMVTFFRKLEEETGRGGTDFFQSHPNPGNRAQSVSKEISTLGTRQYQQDSAEFRSIKQKVSGMKALTAKEIQAGQGKNSGSAGTGTIARSAEVMPNGQFTNFEHNAFTISHPANWQVMGDKTSGVTIAPKNGVSEDSVAYGVIISSIGQQSGAANLEEASKQLVSQMLQTNPGMSQSGHTEEFRLNGKPARSVVLMGASPLRDKNNQPEKEKDWLVLTQASDGSVVYFVFVSPEQDFQALYPTYDKMLRSVRMR